MYVRVVVLRSCVIHSMSGSKLRVPEGLLFDRDDLRHCLNRCVHNFLKRPLPTQPSYVLLFWFLIGSLLGSFLHLCQGCQACLPVRHDER